MGVCAAAAVAAVAAVAAAAAAAADSDTATATGRAGFLSFSFCLSFSFLICWIRHIDEAVVPKAAEARLRRWRSRHLSVMQWSLQDVLFLNWYLLRLTNASSSLSGL